MKFHHNCLLLILSSFLGAALFAAERTGNNIMPDNAALLFHYAENKRWDDFQITLREKFLPKDKNGQDFTTRDGLTLLHFAVQANQEKVVDLLLIMKACVKTHGCFEKDGEIIQVATPLHHAARLGYAPIAEKLIKACPDSINSTICQYDATPLHVAVWHNQPNIVELLLGKGANCSIQNNQGSTPFHLAVWQKTSSILKILLESNQPTLATLMQLNNNYNSALALTVLYSSQDGQVRQEVHNIFIKYLSKFPTDEVKAYIDRDPILTILQVAQNLLTQ